MSQSGRISILLAQNLLTGLDFVQVVDPDVQTTLRLFFHVDPDDLSPVLANAGDTFDSALFEFNIVAVHGEAPAKLVPPDPGTGYENPRWQSAPIGGVSRTFLEFDVTEPGGFEPYKLSFLHNPAAGDDNQIDPFFNSLIFDFKQACETGFDCQSEAHCDGKAGVDFPVDYLARDFHSIRRALLDFSAQRYPDWKEPLEADMAVMLMEIMAAMGDEFSYIQDKNDAETRFASATQRNSLHALARLVDYTVDPGSAAGGEVVVHAAPGFGGLIPAGSLLWASGANGEAVPFNMGELGWIHQAWNDVPVHNPSPDETCLAKGQTSLLLVEPSELGQVPDDPDNPGNPLPFSDFLTGRRMMILSDPADAALSRRAHPVTITRIEQLVDTMVPGGGAITRLIRAFWDEEEAVPFDLPLDGLSAALNVGQVVAGKRVTEYVRAGTENDIDTEFAAAPALAREKLKALPSLIERQGPQAENDGTRSIIFRHGLGATENSSLRFDQDGDPVLRVRTGDIPGAFPNPLPVEPGELAELFDYPSENQWRYLDDILEGNFDSDAFTVEPGFWRTAKTYQLPDGTFEFRDYVSDTGWTLKFGYGDFGRAPADGSILRLEYETDPGAAANISSFAIKLSLDEDHPVDPALAGNVSKAFNPLSFNNARVEESRESVRLNAPQAYRARPLRAVRPEDYSAIIERMKVVQKAHSVTRWTGSWSTDFVSVDPLDSIKISEENRAAVLEKVDCIRLAARDARLLDPDYVDIDIEIAICIAKGFYAGAVVEDVHEALSPPGFFHPDNFTFGEPLYRSALVAAAQAVPGVSHIDDVMIRVHGQGEWRSFSEDALETGPGQIIRLQNDPNRSTLGLLKINAIGEM